MKGRIPHGAIVWADGNRYDGQFVDGAIHGDGEYSWNGRRYKGQWAGMPFSFVQCLKLMHRCVCVCVCVSDALGLRPGLGLTNPFDLDSNL